MHVYCGHELGIWLDIRLSTDHANEQRAVHHIEVVASIPLPMHNVALLIQDEPDAPDHDMRMSHTREQANDIVHHEMIRDCIDDIFADNGLGQFRLRNTELDFDEFNDIFDYGSIKTARCM
jgi:hypothetical protein